MPLIGLLSNKVIKLIVHYRTLVIHKSTMQYTCPKKVDKIIVQFDTEDITFIM